MKNQTDTAGRYMEGVFTPLDSEEVQTACRALWDELDDLSRHLREHNAALLEALKAVLAHAELAHWDKQDSIMGIYCDKARAAIAQAEGGSNG